MNKRVFSSVVTALGAGLLFSASVSADLTSLQNVLNSITSPYPGTSSVNVNTDAVNPDAYWQITASGGSISTFIIELAGYANTFGIYDAANPANSVQLFAGTDGPGNQVAVGIAVDGSVFKNFVDTGVNFAGNLFGYYLGANAGNGGTDIWYSDTALNTDGVDHMLAYQGTGDTVQLPGWAAGTWTPNEYILAWEDLSGGGDLDYDDVVLMVESVTPVPIPAAAWLFGSALMGVVGIGRRRARKA